MSPVKWVQRNFNDAPLQVMDTGGKEPEAVMDHPLIAMLKRPNPYYSGTGLWAGTLYSYIVDGNGYWIKIRKQRGGIPWNENVSSEIEQLVYAPHWLIEPIWPADNSVFISHYRYCPGGPVIDIDPANVVHFRNGLDPRNTRKGMSMIYSELREIFTDDEAAQFLATLLKNMGVPGLIVSPKDSGGAEMTLENADETKKMLRAMVSGDRRGETFVSSIPIDLQQFKIEQAAMDFSTIRATPEERLCAAIGIPAPVCGFGAGLETTKVGATMTEMKRMAWDNCIIPMQTVMDEQLGMSLLPELDAKATQRELKRNYKGVSALQENGKDIADRSATLVKNCIITRGEARQMNGFDSAPTDEVFIQPISVVAVDKNGKIVLSAQPAQPAKPKELKAATDSEEQFQDKLDDIEATTASLVGGQFDDERDNVVRAIGKR